MCFRLYLSKITKIFIDLWHTKTKNITDLYRRFAYLLYIQTKKEMKYNSYWFILRHENKINIYLIHLTWGLLKRSRSYWRQENIAARVCWYSYFFVEPFRKQRSAVVLFAISDSRWCVRFCLDNACVRSCLFVGEMCSCIWLHMEWN